MCGFSYSSFSYSSEVPFWKWAAVDPGDRFRVSRQFFRALRVPVETRRRVSTSYRIRAKNSARRRSVFLHRSFSMRLADGHALRLSDSRREILCPETPFVEGRSKRRAARDSPPADWRLRRWGRAKRGSRKHESRLVNNNRSRIHNIPRRTPTLRPRPCFRHPSPPSRLRRVHPAKDIFRGSGLRRRREPPEGRRLRRLA